MPVLFSEGVGMQEAGNTEKPAGELSRAGDRGKEKKKRKAGLIVLLVSIFLIETLTESAGSTGSTGMPRPK
jgi:hypothetical protein